MKQTGAPDLFMKVQDTLHPHSFLTYPQYSSNNNQFKSGMNHWNPDAKWTGSGSKYRYLFPK